MLFLQGGSTLQFSQIPMTLLRGRTQPAEYLHAGYWSGKSIPEARREGPTKVLWSGEEKGFRRLPADAEIAASREASYFHYVSNETVEGLQFHRMPGDDAVLRICDMSSDFLCRPVDASRCALIYAHAQKNLGPSGMTVVVVRDDIVRAVPPNLVFNLADASLEERFLSEAGREGFHGLDGHRSLGGLRASLYNAVTPASVDALVDFMRKFQRRAG